MVKKLKKRDFFEDATLPLQVHIQDPHPAFPLHGHGFDELVIVMKGTALHVVNGQEMPIKSGDVFVVARTHQHKYQDVHGLALANILFDAAALDMSSWDIQALPGFHALFELEPRLRRQQKFNSRLRLTDRHLGRTSDFLHDLTRETENRPPGYRVMAKGIFMQLAVFLSRCYTEMPTEESVNLLRIGDAIAYIETNFENKIELANLAQKAHLSKRHFQRIFQECVGSSPVEHLLRVRIRKAAELLQQTDLPITEIAFHVGFNDSNYFSRQFRAIMNQSPRQYKMRQEDIA